MLAAGHGTRLYPLTLHTAKPLLPVARKPICEYVVEKIREIDDIDHIYIVSNAKFFRAFELWRKSYQKKSRCAITIVNDGTFSESDRRGAVGDIQFVLKTKRIRGDVLIVGGDNFFDFSILPFVERARAYAGNFCVGLYDFRLRSLVTKYGVVSIDKKGRVTDFEEKPPRPKSTLISMCLYFLPKEKLFSVAEYLRAGNPPDVSGNLARWFYAKQRLYGIVLRGTWFDIGDIESYRRAEEFATAKKQAPKTLAR